MNYDRFDQSYENTYQIITEEILLSIPQIDGSRELTQEDKDRLTEYIHNPVVIGRIPLNDNGVIDKTAPVLRKILMPRLGFESETFQTFGIDTTIAFPETFEDLLSGGKKGQYVLFYCGNYSDVISSDNPPHRKNPSAIAVMRQSVNKYLEDSESDFRVPVKRK